MAHALHEENEEKNKGTLAMRQKIYWLSIFFLGMGLFFPSVEAVASEAKFNVLEKCELSAKEEKDFDGEENNRVVTNGTPVTPVVALYEGKPSLSSYDHSKKPSNASCYPSTPERSCYTPNCNVYDYCDQAPYCDSDSPIFMAIPTIAYRGGPGRSYNNGYESLDLFMATLFPCSRSYPFLDLDFHRVGNANFAGNFGIGWRKFSSNYNKMFGANIYYDMRRQRDETLQQIGFGVELWGDCWDVRVNGYIPIGKNRLFVDSDTFEFNDPYETTRNDFIGGLWGADAEIGTWLCRTCCYDFYVAAGPYFYQSQGCCPCNSFLGGMGRAALILCDYLTVGLSVTYDHIYRTRVQGDVALSIPLPCATSCWRYIFDPVYRNRIIVTEKLSCWVSNF
ncbi:MAG: inverse autotransporter beta domain-containing protein [Chlamydiia bacterium]|nr:inverse autotransporter beta domain-containing protein [Chlamydiia bacterium]